MLKRTNRLDRHSLKVERLERLAISVVGRSGQLAAKAGKASRTTESMTSSSPPGTPLAALAAAALRQLEAARVKDEARWDRKAALPAGGIGWIAWHDMDLRRSRGIVRNQLGGILLPQDKGERVKVARILEPDAIMLSDHKVVHEREAVEKDGASPDRIPLLIEFVQHQLRVERRGQRRRPRRTALRGNRR